MHLHGLNIEPPVQDIAVCGDATEGLTALTVINRPTRYPVSAPDYQLMRSFASEAFNGLAPETVRIL